jgi:leucyl-tRNA synthetase
MPEDAKPSGGGSFVRRDTLVDIEKAVQKQWEDTKPYDRDFPDDGSTGTEGEKWFETFPYPYMNGRLHMGHAFSLTKCEYMVRYQVRAARASLPR